MVNRCYKNYKCKERQRFVEVESFEYVPFRKVKVLVKFTCKQIFFHSFNIGEKGIAKASSDRYRIINVSMVNIGSFLKNYHTHLSLRYHQHVKESLLISLSVKRGF
jgi:hypothetical protein